MDALNAAFKIPLLLGDRRGQEEVPNRVATCRSTFRWKAMLKKRTRRRFGIRECNQAVAKITDWWDAELFAENSGGTPIIRERDDCGECNPLPLKTSERGGHPRPTAEHHNPATATMQTSLLQRAPETGAKPHRLAPREIAMLHHNRGGANDRRQATRKRLNNGNGPMSTSSAANRNTQAATTIRKIGGHACSEVGLN